MKYYENMAQARNAAALDLGFDRWEVNGGRCTIRALAEAGYIVDRAEARNQRGEIYPEIRYDCFGWAEDCGMPRDALCDWDVTAVAVYPGAAEWRRKNPYSNIENPYEFKVMEQRVEARTQTESLQKAKPSLLQAVVAARKVTLRERRGK